MECGGSVLLFFEGTKLLDKEMLLINILEESPSTFTTNLRQNRYYQMMILTEAPDRVLRATDDICKDNEYFADNVVFSDIYKSSRC